MLMNEGGLKMKMFNKALALLLAIVLIMGVAPLSAFSAETKDAKATAKQKSVDTKNLKVIGEVEEKRDEFSKTFELEDGTFYEVKSSEPIHVKKFNKWADSKKVSDPKTVSDIKNTIKQLTETERETQTRDGNDVSNNTSNYDYRYLQDNSSAYNLDSINDDTLLLLKDTSTMTINQAELTYSYIVTLTLNPNVNQNNSSPDQEVGGFVCTDSWTPYSSQQQTPVDDFDDFYYPSISGAECIGTHTISSSGDYSFDATYIYNRWESGAQANYGLCFVGHADSDIEAVFSGVTFSRRYKNISALDTKTTYHTIDMGFAGGAYINDYHNTVDIIRDEIGLPNNTLPVEIKRMISQNDLGEAYYYGDNAYINYHSVMSNQGQTYTWRSLNFETVTFTVSNTSQATNDNEDLGYSLTVSTKTITGPGGRIYKFGTYNSNYYLTSVKDAYDNEITVAYKTSNYKRRINYVEEKANGRRYLFDYTTTSFSYNGNSFSRDVLSSITVKQKSGRDYNNVSIGNAVARVTYLYAPSSSSTFVLQRATYPDNSYIQYTYNNSGRITQAKDVDGRVITFDYSGTIPKYSLSNYTISQTNIARSTAGFVGYEEKVENVDDNSSQYITKSSLSVDNQYAFRRAFDCNGAHVETTFDNEFRTKYVLDDLGDTYLFEYGTTTDSLTQIKKHNSVENIIYNGNFEDGVDGWELFEETNQNEITDSTLNLPDGTSTGVMNITSLGTETSSVAYQIIDASELEIDKTYILDAEAYLNSGACIGDHFNGVELYPCDSDGEIESGATPLVSLTFGEGIPYEKEHKCGYFVFDDDDIEYFVVMIKYTPQFNEGFFDNISLIMDENDSLIKTFTAPAGQEIVISDENTLDPPVETFNRDSHGQVLEHILSANNQTMVEKFSYNSDAPYNTATHTDWNNTLTSFNYSNDTGLLTSKTKNSATTSYTYNQLGLLASVSTVFNNISNNPVTIANSYTYSNNRIASVTHGSMVYSFTYDSLGRVKGVNYSNDSGVTNTALVSSSYANGKVDTITYANGDQIKYTYDTNTKNITKISFKDANDNAFTDMATYQYNVGSGEKIRINDLNGDRRISIFEDGSYSVTDKNTNSVLPELRQFKKQVNSNGVEKSNVFDYKCEKRHNDVVPDSNTGTISSSSTLNLYIDEEPVSFTFTENNEQVSISYGGVHSEDPLSLTTEMTKDSFGRVTNTNAHYETEDEEERLINNEYSYKTYTTSIVGDSSLNASSNLLSVYSTSTESETDLDYDCTFVYEYEEDSDLVKK